MLSFPPDTTSTHQPSLPTTTMGHLTVCSTATGQCHRPSLLSSSSSSIFFPLNQVRHRSSVVECCRPPTASRASLPPPHHLSLPLCRQDLGNLKSRSWMLKPPPFLPHRAVLHQSRARQQPVNLHHHRPRVVRPRSSSSLAVSPTWEPNEAPPDLLLFLTRAPPSRPSSSTAGC